MEVSKHLEKMNQYSRAVGFLEASMRLLQLGYSDSDKKQAELSRTKDSIERLKSFMAEVSDSALSPKASSLYKRQPESDSNAWGDSEEETRRSYDTAVLHLRKAKPGKNAIVAWKEISAWYVKMYGDDGVRRIIPQFNLGLAYAASGQYTEAETQYKSILAQMNEQALTEDSKTAQRVRYIVHTELARVYCEQKRFQDARLAFEAILPGQKILLGEADRDTLTTRYSLAALLQEQDDLDGALKELHAVLQEQCAVMGPNDSATLRTAQAIALNNHLKGKFVKSEKQIKAVLKLQKEKLGNTHYDTVNTRVMLQEMRDERRMVDQLSLLKWYSHYLVRGCSSRVV